MPPAEAPLHGRRAGIVARLVDRKGHRILFEAWRQALESDPVALDGWTLEVWGDGPERGALEVAAEEANLTGRVTFRGAVPSAASRLAELDLLILPSSREGLPLILVEAMAQGLPIVASDLAGCRELLDDAAVLVAPGDVPALADALMSLALDEPRRHELGARARRRVRAQFTQERMISNYTEELLG